MGQFWSQTFPPASKFSVTNIPDLSGKVMLVTGGSGGIGKEIVRALLSHNAKVYLGARDQEKANATIQELKSQTGNEAVFLELDLSSIESIKTAAGKFLRDETELHALFNNAGVMYLTKSPGHLNLTKEGYDVQWGTNVLGPFYLTQLLLPALSRAGANSADKARVTFTASYVQTTGIKWDTLTDTSARKKIGPDERYMQSKFANVVLAREFARRYADSNIVVTAQNPGGIKTDLQRHMPGLMRSMLNMALHPVPMGALTHLWAGTAPEGKDLNGKYLIPWARIGNASAAAQDPAVGEKLWSYLQEQLKTE